MSESHENSAHHFSNIKGIVHFELIPQGETVTQAYYVKILKQLYEGVHRRKV
jgi:hypothetical protein